MLALAYMAAFMRRFARQGWGMLICLGVLLADQAAKHALGAWLPTQGVRLWGGRLTLQMFLNHYQGFGDTFPHLLLACLAGIALALVLYARLDRLHYRMSLWMEVAGGLVMGGVAGVMVDRIRVGAVIDFLEFGLRGAYVYNLADLFVLLGLGLIGMRVLYVAGRVATARK